MDRVPTGISPLDEMMQGGFPKGATVLIVGLPGTGKTILAHQFIFHNATQGKKCIYFSTLSEPPVKILKYQQTFSYFDMNKVGQSIIYRDMGGVLYKEGPKAALALIDKALKQHHPQMIVIDSIKTLSDMIPSVTELRQFLLDLSLRFATWDCTSLLLGEYSETDIQIRPESSIADGIIYLSGLEEHKFQKRFLRILKMRGTRFPGGESSFKITDSGLNIFPRLNPMVSEQTYEQYRERLSTGIPALDEMMNGGIPRGTTTLLSGPAGSGKTIISLCFAHAGLINNESTIFITFEENPQQIISGAIGMKLNIQQYVRSGQLLIIHKSPMELDIDELIHYIQNLVSNNQVTRLVIDSISSFELGIQDKIKYTNYIWAISDFFKAQGVTLFLTHELFNPSRISELSKHGISYIADNLVQLIHRESHYEIRRFLRVVKMRGSAHVTGLQEFSINENGLSLGPLSTTTSL